MALEAAYFSIPNTGMESDGIPLKEYLKPLGGSQELQFEYLDLLLVWFMVSASGGEEDMLKNKFLIHSKAKPKRFDTGETNFKKLHMSGYTGMLLGAPSVACCPSATPSSKHS